MKSCKNIEQLREQFKEVRSVVTDDTSFMAKALMFVAERIDSVSIRKKRKPTAYQLKVGKYMKLGKSVKEAHKLAKEE